MRSRRPLEVYCPALQGGAREKLRAVLPWIWAEPGGEILDVGSGTGLIAAAEARRSRHSSVIAIDSAPEMLAAAQRLYGSCPNLHFRNGVADEVHSASATTVVLSSVLHEVFSYSGGSGEAVARVLRAAWRSLRPGGRLVIRDFIGPACHAKEVLLQHRCSDIVAGHDFASFSRRSRHPVALYGGCRKAGCLIYRTDLGSAFEFVLRKDYHEMWDLELEERYGFWTRSEAEAAVHSQGFRILHSRPFTSAWAGATSLRGKVQLLDPVSLRPLQPGPHQLLLVAER